MTTATLVIITATLALLRACFLLFPRARMRAAYVQFAFLACFAAICVYQLHAPGATASGTSVATRTATLAVVVLVAALATPRGDGGVWTDNQKKLLLEYLDSIVFAGVLALLLMTFVVRSFYIPSESMVPTLKVNDMILVNELAYRFSSPKRGDIVVFHPPPRANSKGQDFVKRVIALGGDTIWIRHYITYLNGVPVSEPYLNHAATEFGELSQNFSPFTVPRGDVFCMGDNRGNSEDSRAWGPLPVKNIIGKATVIFFPLRRIRWLH